MSHFYGTLQGARGQRTACGSKGSGITVYAAGWKGAVCVRVYQDDKGRDCFIVEQTQWRGHGDYAVIAEGVLGKRCRRVRKAKQEKVS